jgi:hypothetical protein
MSSLALGATADHHDGKHHATTVTVTTSTHTTTTPKPPPCHHIALRGTATGGSVSLTVTGGHDEKVNLAGTSVTLTIPVGARVVASVCKDANGALMVRSLQLQAKQEKPKPKHD